MMFSSDVPNGQELHCHNSSKLSALLDIFVVRIFFLKLKLNLSLQKSYLLVVSQNTPSVFVCLGCLSSVPSKELEYDGSVQPSHSLLVFQLSSVFLENMILPSPNPESDQSTSTIIFETSDISAANVLFPLAAASHCWLICLE